MTTDRHDEKDSKKSKLDGLRRMTVEQLTELHDATGKELARRAKEKSKHKKPGEMDDKEYRAWSAKQIAKHEHGDDGDGE